MESLTADGYMLIFHDYGDSHSVEKNFQEDLRAEHDWIESKDASLTVYVYVAAECF